MSISLDLFPEVHPPPISQEDLNVDPLGGAITNYLHHRPYWRQENTMEDNYGLLEPLPDRTDSHRENPKPALTICMPVAIIREEEPTIVCALEAISTAQQKFGRPVDVIVWANAKHNTSNEEIVSMEALQRYDSFRASLTQRHDSGLHIRTALQIRPEDDAGMGQIRGNYMEAVAIDAQRQGLGYDHPILWLDADLIDISNKTFEQVVDAVQSFEDLFVHPMTHYGIDWANGQPLSETDAATKAVAIDEIMRRQKDRNAVRQAGSRPSAGQQYHEENGLAFAIGTYLSAGGLPTQAISESKELIEAAARRNEEARRHYAVQLGVSTDQLPVHIGMLPENTAKKLMHLPKGVLGGVQYLPGAYTAMSARKQNDRVRRDGPSGLQGIWTSNYRVNAHMLMRRMLMIDRPMLRLLQLYQATSSQKLEYSQCLQREPVVSFICKFKNK